MRVLVCMLAILGSVAGQDPTAEVRRFLEAGESDQARAAFQREFGRHQDGQARSACLRAMFQTCADAGALGDLRSWLLAESRSSSDGVLLYFLGFVETRLMFLERGERALKAALAQDPGSPALLSLLATIASRRFRHGEAARLAQQTGSPGKDLARREGRLEQALGSAAPRQWGALILGLGFLAGLPFLVRRLAG